MAWTTPKTFSAAATGTAAEMNTHLRDNLMALNPLDVVTAQTWDPDLQSATNSDPGWSARTGRYWRIGPMVYCVVRWVIEINLPYTTGGPWQVTLPVASSGITSASGTGSAIGSWRMYRDSDSSTSVSGTVILSAAQQARFGLADGHLLFGSVPYIWATGDVLTMCAWYPAA